MAVLFNITHDANNLDEYDSTVTDGGDLSTTTPGLAGTTAKMSVLIDDTNSIYGEKAVSVTTHVRTRFYIHPNSLTIGEADDFCIMEMDADGSVQSYAFKAYLGYESSNYYIYVFGKDDPGAYIDLGHIVISNAEHYVEIYMYGHASAGSLTLWVDGSQEATLGSKDTLDNVASINNVRVGAEESLEAGTGGTFYLDELVVNDDGSEIGAVAEVVDDSPRLYGRHRRMLTQNFG